jgi:hypothetical protein
MGLNPNVHQAREYTDARFAGPTRERLHQDKNYPLQAQVMHAFRFPSNKV